ncbi:MAG TPA: hypothetical protein DDZ60_18415, partial [Planktothrix sp. UBA10369]|nr:hypothetical protein [Planktothrix sp. UBA10369]
MLINRNFNKPALLIRNWVYLVFAIAFGAGLLRFWWGGRDCLEPAPTIGGFDHKRKFLRSPSGRV